MGYDETTNLKLKKPTIGTSKTDWPGYINGNFDVIDAEMMSRLKRGDPFSEITLGGVTRSTWPSPGSGSQSMDDTYNNGSLVNVDNTDEVHRLSAGKKFRLVNAGGSVTYMEAEGGKGITLPDTRQNLIANSQFAVWSSATLENVGSTLISNGTFDADTSGWTPTNGTIASVSGGQSGNCLQITLSSGSVQYADSSAITTVPGKLYGVTACVKSGTGGTAYIVQAFNSGKSSLLGQAAGNTTGLKGIASRFTLKLIKRNTSRASTGRCTRRPRLIRRPTRRNLKPGRDGSQGDAGM